MLGGNLGSLLYGDVSVMRNSSEALTNFMGDETYFLIRFSLLGKKNSSFHGRLHQLKDFATKS